MPQNRKSKKPNNILEELLDGEVPESWISKCGFNKLFQQQKQMMNNSKKEELMEKCFSRAFREIRNRRNPSSASSSHHRHHHHDNKNNNNNAMAVIAASTVISTSQQYVHHQKLKSFLKTLNSFDFVFGVFNLIRELLQLHHQIHFSQEEEDEEEEEEEFKKNKQEAEGENEKKNEEEEAEKKLHQLHHIRSLQKERQTHAELFVFFSTQLLHAAIDSQKLLLAELVVLVASSFPYANYGKEEEEEANNNNYSKALPASIRNLTVKPGALISLSVNSMNALDVLDAVAVTLSLRNSGGAGGENNNFNNNDNINNNNKNSAAPLLNSHLSPAAASSSSSSSSSNNVKDERSHHVWRFRSGLFLTVLRHDLISLSQNNKTEGNGVFSIFEKLSRTVLFRVKPKEFYNLSSNSSASHFVCSCTKTFFDQLQSCLSNKGEKTFSESLNEISTTLNIQNNHNKNKNKNKKKNKKNQNKAEGEKKEEEKEQEEKSASGQKETKLTRFFSKMSQAFSETRLLYSDYFFTFSFSSWLRASAHTTSSRPRSRSHSRSRRPSQSAGPKGGMITAFQNQEDEDGDEDNYYDDNESNETNFASGAGGVGVGGQNGFGSFAARDFVADFALRSNNAVAGEEEEGSLFGRTKRSGNNGDSVDSLFVDGDATSGSSSSSYDDVRFGGFQQGKATKQTKQKSSSLSNDVQSGLLTSAGLHNNNESAEKQNDDEMHHQYSFMFDTIFSSVADEHQNLSRAEKHKLLEKMLHQHSSKKNKQHQNQLTASISSSSSAASSSVNANSASTAAAGGSSSSKKQHQRHEKRINFQHEVVEEGMMARFDSLKDESDFAHHKKHQEEDEEEEDEDNDRENFCCGLSVSFKDIFEAAAFNSRHHSSSFSSSSSSSSDPLPAATNVADLLTSLFVRSDANIFAQHQIQKWWIINGNYRLLEHESDEENGKEEDEEEDDDDEDSDGSDSENNNDEKGNEKNKNKKKGENNNNKQDKNKSLPLQKDRPIQTTRRYFNFSKISSSPQNNENEDVHAYSCVDFHKVKARLSLSGGGSGRQVTAFWLEAKNLNNANNSSNNSNNNDSNSPFFDSSASSSSFLASLLVAASPTSPLQQISLDREMVTDARVVELVGDSLCVVSLEMSAPPDEIFSDELLDFSANNNNNNNNTSANSSKKTGAAAAAASGGGGGGNNSMAAEDALLGGDNLSATPSITSATFNSANNGSLLDSRKYTVLIHQRDIEILIHQEEQKLYQQQQEQQQKKESEETTNMFKQMHHNNNNDNNTKKMKQVWMSLMRACKTSKKHFSVIDFGSTLQTQQLLLTLLEVEGHGVVNVASAEAPINNNNFNNININANNINAPKTSSSEKVENSTKIVCGDHDHSSNGLRSSTGGGLGLDSSASAAAFSSPKAQIVKQQQIQTRQNESVDEFFPKYQLKQHSITLTSSSKKMSGTLVPMSREERRCSLVRWLFLIGCAPVALRSLRDSSEKNSPNNNNNNNNNNKSKQNENERENELSSLRALLQSDLPRLNLPASVFTFCSNNPLAGFSLSSSLFDSSLGSVTSPASSSPASSPASSSSSASPSSSSPVLKETAAAGSKFSKKIKRVSGGKGQVALRLSFGLLLMFDSIVTFGLKSSFFKLIAKFDNGAIYRQHEDEDEEGEEEEDGKNDVDEKGKKNKKNKKNKNSQQQPQQQQDEDDDEYELEDQVEAEQQEQYQQEKEKERQFLVERVSDIFKILLLSDNGNLRPAVLLLLCRACREGYSSASVMISAILHLLRNQNKKSGGNDDEIVTQRLRSLFASTCQDLPGWLTPINAAARGKHFDTLKRLVSLFRHRKMQKQEELLLTTSSASFSINNDSSEFDFSASRNQFSAKELNSFSSIFVRKVAFLSFLDLPAFHFDHSRVLHEALKKHRDRLIRGDDHLPPSVSNNSQKESQQEEKETLFERQKVHLYKNVIRHTINLRDDFNRSVVFDTSSSSSSSSSSQNNNQIVSLAQLSASASATRKGKTGGGGGSSSSNGGYVFPSTAHFGVFPLHFDSALPTCAEICALLDYRKELRLYSDWLADLCIGLASCVRSLEHSFLSFSATAPSGAAKHNTTSKVRHQQLDALLSLIIDHEGTDLKGLLTKKALPYIPADCKSVGEILLKMADDPQLQTVKKIGTVMLPRRQSSVARNNHLYYPFHFLVSAALHQYVDSSDFGASGKMLYDSRNIYGKSKRSKEAKQQKEEEEKLQQQQQLEEESDDEDDENKNFLLGDVLRQPAFGVFSFDLLTLDLKEKSYPTSSLLGGAGPSSSSSSSSSGGGPNVVMPVQKSYILRRVSKSKSKFELAVNVFRGKVLIQEHTLQLSPFSVVRRQQWTGVSVDPESKFFAFAYPAYSGSLSSSSSAPSALNNNSNNNNNEILFDEQLPFERVGGFIFVDEDRTSVLSAALVRAQGTELTYEGPFLLESYLEPAPLAHERVLNPEEDVETLSLHTKFDFDGNNNNNNNNNEPIVAEGEIVKNRKNKNNNKQSKKKTRHGDDLLLSSAAGKGSTNSKLTWSSNFPFYFKRLLRLKSTRGVEFRRFCFLPSEVLSPGGGFACEVITSYPVSRNARRIRNRQTREEFFAHYICFPVASAPHFLSASASSPSSSASSSDQQQQQQQQQSSSSSSSSLASASSSVQTQESADIQKLLIALTKTLHESVLKTSASSSSSSTSSRATIFLRAPASARFTSASTATSSQIFSSLLSHVDATSKQRQKQLSLFGSIAAAAMSGNSSVVGETEKTTTHHSGGTSSSGGEKILFPLLSFFEMANSTPIELAVRFQQEQLLKIILEHPRAHIYYQKESETFSGDGFELAPSHRLLVESIALSSVNPSEYRQMEYTALVGNSFKSLLRHCAGFEPRLALKVQRHKSNKKSQQEQQQQQQQQVGTGTGGGEDLSFFLETLCPKSDPQFARYRLDSKPLPIKSYDEQTSVSSCSFWSFILPTDDDGNNNNNNTSKKNKKHKKNNKKDTASNLKFRTVNEETGEFEVHLSSSPFKNGGFVFFSSSFEVLSCDAIIPFASPTSSSSSSSSSSSAPSAAAAGASVMNKPKKNSNNNNNSSVIGDVIRVSEAAVLDPDDLRELEELSKEGGRLFWSSISSFPFKQLHTGSMNRKITSVIDRSHTRQEWCFVAPDRVSFAEPAGAFVVRDYSTASPSYSLSSLSGSSNNNNNNIKKRKVSYSMFSVMLDVRIWTPRFLSSRGDDSVTSLATLPPTLYPSRLRIVNLLLDACIRSDGIDRFGLYSDEGVLDLQCLCLLFQYGAVDSLVKVLKPLQHLIPERSNQSLDYHMAISPCNKVSVAQIVNPFTGQIRFVEDFGLKVPHWIALMGSEKLLDYYINIHSSPSSSSSSTSATAAAGGGTGGKIRFDSASMMKTQGLKKTHLHYAVYSGSFPVVDKIIQYFGGSQCVDVAEASPPSSSLVGFNRSSSQNEEGEQENEQQSDSSSSDDDDDDDEYEEEADNDNNNNQLLSAKQQEQEKKQQQKKKYQLQLQQERQEQMARALSAETAAEALSGPTPLHLACWLRNQKIVARLLEEEATPSQTATFPCVSIIMQKQLQEEGGSSKQQNNNNKTKILQEATPFDIALTKHTIDVEAENGQYYNQNYEENVKPLIEGDKAIRATLNRVAWRRIAYFASISIGIMIVFLLLFATSIAPGWSLNTEYRPLTSLHENLAIPNEGEDLAIRLGNFIDSVAIGSLLRSHDFMTLQGFYALEASIFFGFSFSEFTTSSSYYSDRVSASSVLGPTASVWDHPHSHGAILKSANYNMTDHSTVEQHVRVTKFTPTPSSYAASSSGVFAFSPEIKDSDRSYSVGGDGSSWIKLHLLGKSAPSTAADTTSSSSAPGNLFHTNRTVSAFFQELHQNATKAIRDGRKEATSTFLATVAFTLVHTQSGRLFPVCALFENSANGHQHAVLKIFPVPYSPYATTAEDTPTPSRDYVYRVLVSFILLVAVFIVAFIFLYKRTIIYIRAIFQKDTNAKLLAQSTRLDDDDLLPVFNDDNNNDNNNNNEDDLNASGDAFSSAASSPVSGVVVGGENNKDAEYDFADYDDEDDQEEQGAGSRLEEVLEEQAIRVFAGSHRAFKLFYAWLIASILPVFIFLLLLLGIIYTSTVQVQSARFASSHFGPLAFGSEKNLTFGSWTVTNSITNVSQELLLSSASIGSSISALSNSPFQTGTSSSSSSDYYFDAEPEPHVTPIDLLSIAANLQQIRRVVGFASFIAVMGVLISCTNLPKVGELLSFIFIFRATAIQLTFLAFILTGCAIGSYWFFAYGDGSSVGISVRTAFMQGYDSLSNGLLIEASDPTVDSSTFNVMIFFYGFYVWQILSISLWCVIANAYESAESMRFWEREMAADYLETDLGVAQDKLAELADQRGDDVGSSFTTTNPGWRANTSW